MIDIFNIPDKSMNNQVFRVNSSGSTAWQTWSKPNNASFVYILCLGGGGGGGQALDDASLIEHFENAV